MRLTVSQIEAYRLYRNGVIDSAAFEASVFGTTIETEDMAIGRVVHSYLDTREASPLINTESIDNMLTVEDLAGIPEVPLVGRIGEVEVRGRVDRLDGQRVVEFKTTRSQFKAIRYITSYQWRLYLCLSGAARCNYVVIEMSNDTPSKATDVYRMNMHEYTGMLKDCENMAAEASDRIHMLSLEYAMPLPHLFDIGKEAL